jgi:hypothetical protein
MMIRESDWGHYLEVAAAWLPAFILRMLQK